MNYKTNSKHQQHFNAVEVLSKADYLSWTVTTCMLQLYNIRLDNRLDTCHYT